MPIEIKKEIELELEIAHVLIRNRKVFKPTRASPC
jgi:hypothetical protein